MNAKETKALVKNIRESIKKANYEEAIQNCERLLKSDPKNAMGYLLLGAAYQNINKAEATKYLQKSIEYTDGPATAALQGLASCAQNAELPKIYDQLLDLLPEKRLGNYEKLYALAADPEMALPCFELFKKRSQNNSDEDSHALQYLGKLWLANDFKITALDGELFANAMESLLSTSDLEVKNSVYRRYLKWLYKEKNFVRCIRNACIMAEIQPTDVYAYEWICKIYCENHDQLDSEVWKEEMKAPIHVFADELLKLNPNSHLALLAKAISFYAEEQYISAHQLAVQAHQIQPTYRVTLELLACIYMELGAYSMASLFWLDLNVCGEKYAQCLSHEKDNSKLRKAIDLLESYESTNENVQALARCYYKLDEVQQLKSLPLDKLLQAKYQMAPAEALMYIDTIDTFESFVLRGKLQLKLENYSEALNCMLRATRLKPHFAKCFEYLGRIYQKTGDISRARKCFEKCISLDALALDAVDSLSLIYYQLGEYDLNEALIQNTLKQSRNQNNVTLQYKLGHHYMLVNKWDNAIQCFRSAIKYDFQCTIYWEALGDAYAGRGSHNSALRVFKKILELSPGNIYAQLQIALIKTTIRMYSEAIVDFNEILKQNDSYLPGLKGAAEAHVGLAKSLKAQNLYGRVKDHFQQAVNYLQSAFSQTGGQGNVWLWRLTASVFLETAQLPQSLANLDVKGSLARRDQDIAYLSRKDLIQLARMFYLCALKLKQNTYLWYELALCSYYNAVYIPEEATCHLETAIKVCKMAIKCCRTRWQNWNLLGVIYMHPNIENMPMAQHCFVQAVTFERKSFVTWTNLGVLYLRLRDIRLANMAFKRAQQASPIYPNAWIGQAMVAEIIGEQEEAFDLFRHCQQFDYHPESAIGYAHWVCHVLTSPEFRKNPHHLRALEHMQADIYALDAINWYVQNEEADTNIAALTFQGFLCVRQKLYKQAINAFTGACKLATAVEDRDKIYTNLGYVYLKLGQLEKAVSNLNAVAHATLKPIIGLALAYYRSGQLQESYSIYNSVLNSVVGRDDEMASTILVAMSSMVYAFQGESDTKTLLYQCLLLKNVPVEALYSVCALSILHHDSQLCQTIMAQLTAYIFDKEHCADVAYLIAHYYLINNDARQAVNYLQRCVRMFPQNAALRKVFSKFLLDYFAENPKYQLATSSMALITLTLRHSNFRKSVNSNEAAEASIYASRALMPVDKVHSLKLIQRAIRLDPTNQQARLIFSSLTA